MSASSLANFKVAFYKRPWFLITIAIVVVVAVSVITDLPNHISRSQDLTAQNDTIGQINADIDPCVYSIKESFSFYNMSLAGKLTPSDRSQVPGLLVGDQTACSFASGAVYDLTNNIEVIDTRAGKHIDQMLSVIVSWVTSDALAAIEDIQNLFQNPGKLSLIDNLTKQEAQLSKDRAAAFHDLTEASRIVGKLKNPILPKLPHLTGT